MKKKKVALLIDSMECGGSERVMSVLANTLVDDVQVLLVTFSDSPYFYNVRNEVDQYVANLRISGNRISQLVKRFVVFIKLIVKLYRFAPSTLLSFGTTTNVYSIIIAKIIRKKAVICERTNPLLLPTKTIYEKLRKGLYKYADTLVLQTLDSKRAYDQLKVKTPAISVVPNPLSDIENINTQKEKIILAVGRLSYEKGHDVLLEALSTISLPSEWKVIFVGEGKDRKILEEKVVNNNLTSVVRFEGYQTKVSSYYSKASIFVLSSRFEGFPNALCEAMAYGCACISADCDFGPRSIIKDGVNGTLFPVEDSAILANKITELVQDKTKRNQYGIKGKEIVNQLSRRKIVKQWQELIDV